MAVKLNTPHLKPRTDLHWARRLWHVGGVLFVTALYVLVDRWVALTLLGVAGAVFILPDFYRLRNPTFNQFVLKRFRLILRDSEANQLSGVTYILIGIFTVVFLFPKPIATLALLFLALGDPAASVFGVLYGKDKLIGNKSLQGAAASFLVCGLVAFIFYLTQGLMMERILLASILSGLFAAISETICIRKLDDNLTFPILSAFSLWGLFQLFGAYS